MHRINQIEYLPERALKLHFADGTVLVKDFAPLIARGGVFARLADETYWRQGRVDQAGRTLEWPPLDSDPITALDFCADALWFEARPADYAAFQRELDQPRDTEVARIKL